MNPEKACFRMGAGFFVLQGLNFTSWQAVIFDSRVSF